MRPIIIAVVAAAIAAPVADAAAPRYILVSGPGLARPALLADWDENLRLLVSLVDAPRVSRPAARRPVYDLALFWGVPAKAVPTRPRDTSQHGWFYPAAGSRPAVVDLVLNGERYPRVATPAALRILARHGVPVRRR